MISITGYKQIMFLEHTLYTRKYKTKVILRVYRIVFQIYTRIINQFIIFYLYT